MEYANDMKVLFLGFREKNGSLFLNQHNAPSQYWFWYTIKGSLFLYKCPPVNTTTYTVFQASNICMVITSLKGSQSDVWKQENPSQQHWIDAVDLNVVHTVNLNLDPVSILQKITELPVNILSVFRKKPNVYRISRLSIPCSQSYFNAIIVCFQFKPTRYDTSGKQAFSSQVVQKLQQGDQKFLDQGSCYMSSLLHITN